MLPSELRQFQTELAGRLVLMDNAGAELKQLRERYGFTQEWLAGILGMRRESLSRIESGRIQPSLPFLQRFTRIITLSRGVREHLAYAEARGNLHDENHLNVIGQSLRLEKEAADEVVLASMMAYEQKRRQALKALPRSHQRGPRP